MKEHAKSHETPDLIGPSIQNVRIYHTDIALYQLKHALLSSDIQELFCISTTVIINMSQII